MLKPPTKVGGFPIIRGIRRIVVLPPPQGEVARHSRVGGGVLSSMGYSPSQLTLTAPSRRGPRPSPCGDRFCLYKICGRLRVAPTPSSRKLETSHESGRFVFYSGQSAVCLLAFHRFRPPRKARKTPISIWGVWLVMTVPGLYGLIRTTMVSPTYIPLW